MSKAEFYYEFATRQLAAQDQTNTGYQERAFRIVTVAVTLLGAAAVAVGLSDGPLPTSWYFRSCATILLGLFLVTMFAAIFALFHRRWLEGANPSDVREYFSTHGKEGLLEWVGDRCEESYKCNAKTLIERSGYLQVALVCLCLEATAVALLAAIIGGVFG